MENVDIINEVIENEGITDIMEVVELPPAKGSFGKVVIVIGGVALLAYGAKKLYDKVAPAIRKKRDERDIARMKKKGYVILDPELVIPDDDKDECED